MARGVDMMEINGLEFFVLLLWGVGAAAGLWFYLSTRTLRSLLVLGASVVVPVLGSTAAVVLALGRLSGTAPRQQLRGDLDHRAAPEPQAAVGSCHDNSGR